MMRSFALMGIFALFLPSCQDEGKVATKNETSGSSSLENALGKELDTRNPLSYEWKSVVVGGGGAVDGIVIHPLAKDLVYMRTDVGGIYRWDEASKSWTPLTDWIPFKEWNLYGGEAIAVDPSDKSGNVVYASFGKYVKEWGEKNGGIGCVMKSSDRGRTWIKTSDQFGAAVCVNGELLAVDPLDGKRIFHASRRKGLIESQDGGDTWAQAGKGLESLPLPPTEPKEDLYSFVVFDPSSGSCEGARRTKSIYVGTLGYGIFRSVDGGSTWSLMEGSPKSSRRACVAGPGELFVSHKEGVAKWDNGKWSDVTPAPAKKGYLSIAVDPSDSKHVLVGADDSSNGQTPIFRSTDGGVSWKPLKAQVENTVPWWRPEMFLRMVFSLTFDPRNPKRVWATDWYGSYRTDDISAEPSKWTNYLKNHEEVVTIGALIAPAGSKYRLYSGVADVGGFDHESLDRPPSKSVWDKGFAWNTTTGLACSQSDPNFLVRVGGRNWNLPNKAGAYSLDGGDTWVKFPSVPYNDIRGGRAAIPGKGRRVIWVPQIGEPYLTDDLGKTWRKLDFGFKAAAVMPGNHIFFYEQPIAVDLENPDRVYVSCHGKILCSDDAGDTWKTVASGLPRCKAVFSSGLKDDVWLASGNDGLRHSTDGGATWTKIESVGKAILACAGKPMPGAKAAIFLCGSVNGTEGYFRSDDLGASWVKIDTMPDQRIGNDPNTIIGDWRVPGGVFVGTNGRGIFHGVPSDGK